MKFSDMTPHELALKTIEDIARKKQLKRNAEREALEHCVTNRQRINKKLKKYSYASKKY